MWKFYYTPKELHDIKDNGVLLTQGFGEYLRAVFLPFMKWLPLYRKEYIRPDVLAGITVSAILIPQVMAYALLIGLPPHLGLFSALVAALVGALWGSSSHVSTGPTAVISILIFTVLVPFATVGSSEFIALAVGLAILVGLFQLLLGFFRFGFIARLIPHSVLLGFSSAAGIIIALSQVPSLFGFSVVQKSYAIQTVIELVTHFTEFHLHTLILGFFSVVVIFYFKWQRSSFPISLALLIGGIILSYLFSFEAFGIEIIGSIPNSLPSFAFPGLSLDGYLSLLGAAFIIALIGFTETFSIAKVISNDTKEKISANQELIGQGLSNIASGFFGGFAVAGSFSRSAVNHEAGAKTGMSSIAVFVILLLSLLFLTQFLYYLPKAILAAIVIGAVFQLINLPRIREIFRISRTDGMVAVVTFFAAFLFSLEDAVFIGVFLALAMFLQRVMWANVVEEGVDKKYGNILRRVSDETDVELSEGMVIARIEMPYFYANGDFITAQLRDIYNKRKREERIHMFVLDFRGVTYLDLTALEQLAEFVSELDAGGVKTYFIYAKVYERNRLRKAKDILGEVNILYTLEELKEEYSRVLEKLKTG